MSFCTNDFPTTTITTHKDKKAATLKIVDTFQDQINESREEEKDSIFSRNFFCK
ncbi:MAG: hypothetical protein JO327_02785 [Nitrososphaeraceae archaeon]|nr:hypothetical protein [Nitrososphaeraceae archaeon]